MTGTIIPEPPTSPGPPASSSVRGCPREMDTPSTTLTVPPTGTSPYWSFERSPFCTAFGSIPEESGVAAVAVASSDGSVAVGSGVSAGGLLGAADEGEGADELLALALADADADVDADADTDGEEEGLAVAVVLLLVDFPPSQAASPSPSTRTVGRISIRARGTRRGERPTSRRAMLVVLRGSRPGEAISVDVIDHHHHPRRLLLLFQSPRSPSLPSQP